MPPPSPSEHNPDQWPAAVADLLRLGDLTDDLLIIADDKGRIRYCNDAAARLYGRSKECVVGRRLAEFIAPGPGRAAHRRLVSDALTNGNRASGRVPTVAGDGSVVEMEITTVRDVESGDWYTVQRNITDSVRRQRELERLNSELRDVAMRDELTGLANRRALLAELDRALATGENVALALLDLDDFKLVNDSLGHGHGDQLLRYAADRLLGSARGDDVVARLSSDEFFVLIRTSGGVDDVVERATALRDRVAEPYVIAGRLIQLSCSIGIVMADPANDGAGDVLRHVDIAANKAKAEGRGHCVVFDDHLREEVQGRFDVESDLRRALGDGQIDVALQGIFGAADRKLQGFEALARWHHPERGMVPPDKFIEIAEVAGLLDDVTVAVLTKSLEYIGGWLQQPDRTLSINFAPSQLRAPDMPDRLLSVLDVFSVSPSNIVIEITEVGLTGALCAALTNLHRLRDAGFHLAIDDFGKGASSLGYLRDFPLTVVKIDGSFVHHLAEDDFAAAITGSVIDLANRLGLAAVAECVETEEQLARLVEMGCHRVQGYLLHKPSPAQDAAALGSQFDATSRAHVD